MKWIGFDRIMFSSDYPHWDFDDPFMALPPSLTTSRRAHDLLPTTRARCTGWIDGQNDGQHVVAAVE